MQRYPVIIIFMFFGWKASAQNFTLKSNELGGQLTNKQFFNGMGFSGQNQ